MKKICLVSGAIIITASLYLLLLPKERPINHLFIKDINISPDDYASDFKEINRLVKRHYSLLTEKNIRIDSLYDLYAGQVEKARSATEYGELIIPYFAGLQNGHASPNFRQYSADYEAITIEDHTFIDRVPENLPACQNIRAKDEILAIDNIPIRQWLEKQSSFISASTQQGIAICADEMVFSSYSDTLRRFTIRTQEGVKDLSVSLTPAGSRRRLPAVYGHVFEDSIGYIAITTMMNKVVEEFEQIYTEVKDLPYLIIDVRKTGEGTAEIHRKLQNTCYRSPTKHACPEQHSPLPRKRIAANYSF